MVTTNAGIVTSTRAQLGRVGVWTGILRRVPTADEPAFLRQVEELGFGSVWTGEVIGGQEAFAHAAMALASTSTLMVGTGIANLWGRHPAVMQAGGATLAASWPGRFVLGVGVSHAPLVDGSGQEYLKPFARMARYLDDMDHEATSTRPEQAFPRVIAALRPRMLQLAREHADGAHPYFVPVEHTPAAREILGPHRLLVPEQAVLLETDPARAREIARKHVTSYLRLPNYVNNLKHLGYSDDDVAGSGSDRLVDAIVVWGDEAAVARRVAEHLAAGADTVLIQPLADDLAGVQTQLERLAPAVLVD